MFLTSVHYLHPKEILRRVFPNQPPLDFNATYTVYLLNYYVYTYALRHKTSKLFLPPRTSFHLLGGNFGLGENAWYKKK